MLEMLQEAPWRFYPLTLQLTSSRHAPLLAGGKPLPLHVRLLTAPLDQLPAATAGGSSQVADEEEVDDDDEDGEEEEEEGDEDDGAGGLGSGGEDGGSQLPPWDGGCIDLCDDDVYDMPGGGEWWEDAPTASQQPSQQPSQPSQAGGGRKRAAKPGCRACGERCDRHVLHCAACAAPFHVQCLSQALAGQRAWPPHELPSHGACPGCAAPLVWLELLCAMEFEGWASTKRGRKAAQAAAGCVVPTLTAAHQRPPTARPIGRSAAAPPPLPSDARHPADSFPPLPLPFTGRRAKQWPLAALARSAAARPPRPPPPAARPPPAPSTRRPPGRRARRRRSRGRGRPLCLRRRAASSLCASARPSGSC